MPTKVEETEGCFPTLVRVALDAMFGWRLRESEGRAIMVITEDR
jgi:hypothetical protein